MKREFFNYFSSMAHCLKNDFLLMLGTFLMAYQRSTSETADLTAGDYLLFSSYFYRFTGPLSHIEYAYKQIGKSLSQADDLMQLLELKGENWGAKLKAKIEGGITVQNVSFSYVEGAEVLHNVTFEVPEGKTVALVGPTGSGKSTMIRLLYRFLEPNH
uniref:ABC transporter domain-containing protein n=2 Tax=Bursaphelenchus xylophilus TaxID=6326 RepID=A0A1I7SPG8_BURXY